MIQKEILEKINEDGVSIVIGARNEYPQIAMTICSIMEDMRSTGITKWEIIIMDNGSDDETSRFFAWKPISKGDNKNYSHLGSRWAYQYSPRGLIAEDRLRIFYDPVCSNVGTRNKGTLKARYKYVIFSDAHISVRLGTVYYVVETLMKYGGTVHAPISWMGASSDNPQAGTQYSYKVGEKIWGTWIKVKVSEDKPFYIPLCGHAFIGVVKDQFLEYGGYPYAQRVYGGGEPYLDTLYWMVGSHAMMDPRALVYHLSAGRGYSWDGTDLIHNMLLVSYILGGEKWLDRIMITYLNKPGVNKLFLKQLREEAVAGGQANKDWLDEHKVIGFDELLGLDKEDLLSKMSKEEIDALEELWWCRKCTKRGRPDPHVMRMWDIKNEEVHGNHRSWVEEFKLTKDKNGIFIGRTPITDPDAMELANKYL